MNKDNKKNQRLGIRFHQTFIPERHYISSLLEFIEKDGTGNDQEISEITGIPTGKSSGKVPAIIKYCQGMGLIEIKKEKRIRKLVLTALGLSVLKHDPYLGKAVTQWIIHLNLCRRNGGSEIWHLCFGKGGDVLGNEFNRTQLEDYLSSYSGRAKRSLTGPMIRTYESPEALKIAGALMGDKDICRVSAPLLPEFAYAYSAFFLSLWETHFPDNRQITITDFEKQTFWGRIHAWNDRQQETALDLIREKGAIDIDKQMRPWVLIRSKDSSSFWPLIYEDSKN